MHFLIHFFDGKNNPERDIFCLGSSITRCNRAINFQRVGTTSANFFGNGNCELIANFCAKMATS